MQNRSIIFSDPPRHTQLRNLVNKAFTSAAVDPNRKGDPSKLGYLAEMDGYFAKVLEYRRQSPGDDLISGLVAAEVDGDRLTEKGHALHGVGQPRRGALCGRRPV